MTTVSGKLFHTFTIL